MHQVMMNKSAIMIQERKYYYQILRNGTIEFVPKTNGSGMFVTAYNTAEAIANLNWMYNRDFGSPIKRTKSKGM